MNLRGLIEAVTCECGAVIDEMDAITCKSGATLCHFCAVSNLHDALSLTTGRLEELFRTADLSAADEGYEAAIQDLIKENHAILRALDDQREGGE